jgi:hypothetical protein
MLRGVLLRSSRGIKEQSRQLVMDIPRWGKTILKTIDYDGLKRLFIGPV